MRPHEFTNKIKMAAWMRADGKCEICQQKIVGRAEYDHILPVAFSGESSLENCQVTCSKCHRLKTSTQDVPAIAKADRIKRKSVGAKRSKYKWPKRKFGQ